MEEEYKLTEINSDPMSTSINNHYTEVTPRTGSSSNMHKSGYTWLSKLYTGESTSIKNAVNIAKKTLKQDFLKH